MLLTYGAMFNLLWMELNNIFVKQIWLGLSETAMWMELQSEHQKILGFLEIEKPMEKGMEAILINSYGFSYISCVFSHSV